jgi:hypothetical protein
MNDFYELTYPIIEYVDVIRNNPRDTNKVTFVVKGDPTQTIKWCRKNFGERGDGWDFTAGTRHVQLTIWSSKLITMYELWMN